MAKQRRTDTREFEVEAVRRIAAEGKSLAEIARELGLGESLLRSWKTTLASEGERAFPGKGHLPAGRRPVDVRADRQPAGGRRPGEGRLPAFAGRGPGGPLGPGGQYASEHYRRVLSGHGIACSMSRRADRRDDAPTESFLAGLKKGLVHDEDYATRGEARSSLFEDIEVFYNRARRHSSLGYRSPIECERVG